MQSHRVRRIAVRDSPDDERGFFLERSGYTGGVQSECDGEEEDEDSRTEIIRSVSEIGDMVDFLKANPFVSMDDYMWKLSVPMIRIMSIDNTRVHYLSENQAKKKGAVKINGAEDLMNDLGIPLDLIGNKANIITAQGKLEG